MSGTRPCVIELVDALADAAAWPRSRPARVVLGDRASMVDSLSFLVDDSSLETVQAGAAAILSTPPGPAFARAGRRQHDPLLDEGGPVADWIRAERIVIDASELLAGGRGGYDERLASLIADGPSVPLIGVPRDEYKLVGFVPEKALEQVRGAVFAAGAGVIGDYTGCSYMLEGKGTFRGNADSSPTVGDPGSFEVVSEVRFETLLPARLRDAVCRAYSRAHPYEEPAYDLHVLASPAEVGFGRRVATGSDAATVAARLNGAGVTAKVLGNGNRSNGEWVAASGSLQRLLGDLIGDDTIRGVVGGAITPAERRLLEERGIAAVGVDHGALLRTLGTAVVEGIARRLDMDARFLAPLEFPGART